MHWLSEPYFSSLKNTVIDFYESGVKNDRVIWTAWVNSKIALLPEYQQSDIILS
jgi:hypothetical protein